MAVKDVRNIRYGELGKIAFDYKGTVVTIKEPIDVLLVGIAHECYPAQVWIWKRYSYMLRPLGNIRAVEIGGPVTVTA